MWIGRTTRGGISNWGGTDYTPEPLVEARTEGDGSFVLSGLPPGSYDLRTTSWEFAETVLPNVEAGQHGVEIRLANGVSVHGVVVDGNDSSPIEGARVELGIGLSFNLQYEKETLTDAAGAFEIHGIVRDNRKVQLRVRHPDYPRDFGGAKELVNLGRSRVQSEIEVRLYRPDRIRGWVVDANGVPVTGADVRLETEGFSGLYAHWRSASRMGRARTDGEGTFSMDVSRG